MTWCVKQQAIAWANVDQDLHHHMATLGPKYVIAELADFITGALLIIDFDISLPKILCLLINLCNFFAE